ncbi:hypothetical protein H1Q63_10590 [Desmonostoc muscorum CCALA 125]|nr:hypothetical protein [Desmonostoc muscorum CCALA 125]
MALMVPESISSNASQGEQILYKIFREKLSNDFFIWYGHIALENRLDFLIIAPNLGVLILEVIPWYPSQIISADTNAIQVLYSQNEKTKKREEQQSLSYLDIPGRRTRKRSTQAKVGVESYQWNIHKYQELLENLSDKLKNYQIITQSDETYQAKLAFPVGCGFVFSNITCEQGQEKRIEQLLPKSQIIYRNENPKSYIVTN